MGSSAHWSLNSHTRCLYTVNIYIAATNDLLPRFQSAYRKRHSTETAMLRVWSDILTAADQRHVTLLGLLEWICVQCLIASTMRKGTGSRSNFIKIL